jgi:hypothetical protein
VQVGKIIEWLRVSLALGVCPTVSLAKARQRRDKARELLADDYLDKLRIGVDVILIRTGT